MTDAHRITLDPDPFDQFNIALGYRVGGLVIVSGQASIDEAGNIVGVGDFDAQAEQTFANLRRVLEAGGSGLDKIVKVTIYLTDMATCGPSTSRARGRPTRSSASRHSASRSWRSRSRPSRSPTGRSGSGALRRGRGQSATWAVQARRRGETWPYV
jgi:enamine deaminase RidA (YjgF/YER057c/UK114 family)